MNTTTRAPGNPRCANCGHDLTGAINSSKCPECGRPLVEVLMRDDSKLLKLIGRRYTSKAKLLGIPAISIAYGVDAEGKQGHAKGWIALGDRATGVVACGGMSMGVVSFGGLSIGLFSIGGLSIGALLALGGAAIAPLGLACGGAAIGLLAQGGLAVGVGAIGGTVLAIYGLGPPGATFATHSISFGGGGGSEEATAFFERFRWIIGSTSQRMPMRSMFGGLVLYLCAAIFFTLPAILRWWWSDGEERASEDNPRTISER